MSLDRSQNVHHLLLKCIEECCQLAHSTTNPCFPKLVLSAEDEDHKITPDLAKGLLHVSGEELSKLFVTQVSEYADKLYILKGFGHEEYKASPIDTLYSRVSGNMLCFQCRPTLQQVDDKLARGIRSHLCTLYIDTSTFLASY